MLIKLVLVLFFGALLLLASADVLLNFARSSVAENITRSALTLLLSAFALLMLTAIIKSSHYLIGQVRHFFSASQRLQRRLFFFANKQAQFAELVTQQRQQLYFFKQQQQRQLLNKNNRQQVEALSKTIQHQLIMLKPSLSAAAFKRLQTQHKRYRRQLNSEGLIDLLHTIESLTKC